MTLGIPACEKCGSAHKYSKKRGAERAIDREKDRVWQQYGGMVMDLFEDIKLNSDEEVTEETVEELSNNKGEDEDE